MPRIKAWVPGLAARARYVRCKGCGDRHVWRRALPGSCLGCDIHARLAAGEQPAAIAERFDLPRFLVEEMAARG